MAFVSECLEIAPGCEERMLGREGLPLLGEAGIFLTGPSRLRDHYLIRRNRPEFHILMVSHDEGGALLTDQGEQPIPAGSLIFLPSAVPGGLRLIGERWQISWILLDDVPRWQHLRYEGFDQFGRKIDRTVDGFHARVVQHETDHLDGVLYPMRIKDLRRFGFSEVLFPDTDTSKA